MSKRDDMTWLVKYAYVCAGGDLTEFGIILDREQGFEGISDVHKELLFTMAKEIANADQLIQRKKQEELVTKLHVQQLRETLMSIGQMTTPHAYMYRLAAKQALRFIEPDSVVDIIAVFGQQGYQACVDALMEAAENSESNGDTKLSEVIAQLDMFSTILHPGPYGNLLRSKLKGTTGWLTL